jgi:hypothetical protein
VLFRQISGCRYALRFPPYNCVQYVDNYELSHFDANILYSHATHFEQLGFGLDVRDSGFGLGGSGYSVRV